MRLQKCCIVTSILIVVFIVAFFVIYMINSSGRLQKIESVLPNGSIVSDITPQDLDNANRFTDKTGISLNLAVPQHKQLVRKINNGNWYFMNDIMEKDGLKILIVAFRNDESPEGEYQIIVEVEQLKNNCLCLSENFFLHSSDFNWSNIQNQKNSCIIFNKSKTYISNNEFLSNASENISSNFQTTDVGVEYKIPCRFIKKHKNDIVLFDKSTIQLWGTCRVKDYANKEKMIGVFLEYGNNKEFGITWDYNALGKQL